ncbi:fungal-specific transcription factor domain-containing protein [Aspergillus aurantiobrunneus]
MAIAWAAHILRNQCSSRDISQYDQKILVHKCRSLEYLRNMVPQHTNDETTSIAQTKGERDALLLLVMFHCLLEIASGSTKEWTYHMQGALLIIKFYTNLAGTNTYGVFSHEVLELVYNFFLEKQTFLGTTTAATVHSNAEEHIDNIEWSTEVPALFPFLTGRGSMKINPCMGLSAELLDIISSISNVARKRRTPNISQEFTHLRHRLNNLETQPMDKPDSNASKLMELHSKAFESATWIYFHHAVGDQPRESEIIQSVHLPRLLNTLSQIHQIHGPLLGFLPYPMWALFIASCVVLEEERVKILK